MKVETSSDVPRKSLANFVNLWKRSYGLQITLGQSSEIFGPEIAQNTTSCSKGKKLLKEEKVTRNMKSCQKVAEQLVEKPYLVVAVLRVTMDTFAFVNITSSISVS